MSLEEACAEVNCVAEGFLFDAHVILDTEKPLKIVGTTCLPQPNQFAAVSHILHTLGDEIAFVCLTPLSRNKEFNKKAQQFTNLRMNGKAIVALNLHLASLFEHIADVRARILTIAPFVHS
jgi:hypothetical protein